VDPAEQVSNQLSLLAGRIEFFDMQNPQQAQESLVIALQAAQDANDSLLGAAVLAHMAFIPAFSGDARRAEEARDKIRAAREFARRASAPAEMLAWLDAVEAETETRFGNTRRALQLINHAEDIFATGQPRPLPPWLDWFSEVRLAGFKGNTLLMDRQPGPARETLQHVLDNLREDEAKQKSVILGDLAAVAVRENDPEEACRLAEMALDQLVRNWYATGMARVRAVRESLSQWDSLPAVRRLDEKLYGWNTTVNPKLRLVRSAVSRLAWCFACAAGWCSDYFKVSGIGVPMRSKASRWALVGSASMGTVTRVPAKRTWLRVRVARCSSRPRKLR